MNENDFKSYILLWRKSLLVHEKIVGYRSSFFLKTEFLLQSFKVGFSNFYNNLHLVFLPKLFFFLACCSVKRKTFENKTLLSEYEK